MKTVKTTEQVKSATTTMADEYEIKPGGEVAATGKQLEVFNPCGPIPAGSFAIAEELKPGQYVFTVVRDK